MKLRNLFEADLGPEDIRQAVQKHLVVEVFIEGSVRETVGYAEVHIITDVPPISREQFRKLEDTSFEIRSLAEYIRLFPVHLRRDDGVWQEWLQRTYADGDVMIEAMQWKQFVSYMKSTYPDEGGDDDFSD